MAKFELKFQDVEDMATISAKEVECSCIKIQLSCPHNDITTVIFLDKSTAIKFAKTLRTEINKITEGEENGRK
jgi:hypothetical protein